jgi:hypothetical protein
MPIRKTSKKRGKIERIYGMNKHVSKKEREIGSTRRRFLKQLGLSAVTGAMAAPLLKDAAGAEVSFPPRLPGGRSVVTETSQALLKPPPSLKTTAVAKTAPTIDFLYYPGQNYKGNPWSNWGDGVAIQGKYYSAIGDHKGPDGNAFVYEYDSATKSLRCIVNVQDALNVPKGHYTPGKIHSRLDMGGPARPRLLCTAPSVNNVYPAV